MKSTRFDSASEHFWRVSIEEILSSKYEQYITFDD